MRTLFVWSVFVSGCSSSGLSAGIPDPAVDPTDPGPDADPVVPAPTDPTTPAATYDDIAQIVRTDAMFTVSGSVWEADTYLGADAVGHAFYATHGDDYDFLAVYTEADVVDRFAWAVKYDYSTTGLGEDWPNGPTPAMAGSAGKLLQIDMMTWTDWYTDDPSETSILVHETTHAWGAMAQVTGGIDIRESEYGAHWNVFSATGGNSALGYGDLVDLGGGQFSFEIRYPLQLSALELYLAGLVPASEVPPMFHVRSASGFSPAIPPYEPSWTPGSYGMDVTYSGIREDFDIGDVIAANGPRNPSYVTSQKDFRMAFVMVCEATCRPADLAVVEAQRQAFATRWSAATGGRSTMDTSL
ncbi:MAG: hypothetical protein R3F61_36525 [Myxococcota bacterium]